MCIPFTQFCGLRYTLRILADEPIEPAEDLKVPLEAVSVLQYPVVLVWQDD